MALTRNGVTLQGSVLGPILFVVYIDDIDTCIGLSEGIISKFADDTKVAKVVKDNKTAAEMQDTINNLEIWAEKWGMKFNTKRCTRYFSTKNKDV